MIKKSISKICDKTGYMKSNNCVFLLDELSKKYKFPINLYKILISKINKISINESNIFPGKIHFKDFTNLIKNVEFEGIFVAIMENRDNVYNLFMF